MAYLKNGRFFDLQLYEDYRAERIIDPCEFKVDGIYKGMLRLNSTLYEAGSKQARFHGRALTSSGMTVVRFAFADEFKSVGATAIEPFEDGYINLRKPLLIQQRDNRGEAYSILQAYFLEYDPEEYGHSQ